MARRRFTRSSSTRSWPTPWTLNGPAVHGGIGLLLGVQILTARTDGAGRPHDAGLLWRQGLVIAVVTGLIVCGLVWSAGGPLFAAFGIAPGLAARGAAVARVLAISVPLHLMFMTSTNFLEGLQRPMPGAATMWAANAVNLVLNLALVPSWGAIGSAWATVLSRLFLVIAIVAYIFAAPSLKRYRARELSISSSGYGALLTIGGAAAVSAIVESGAFAALSVIAARSGETAVATFVIATGGLVTLAYLFAQGYATAGAVLISEAIGRGEANEASRAGWHAIALTAIAMAATGAACMIFAPQVARSFTSDSGTIASLVSVMLLIALLMIPDGGQGVADAVLRARGDNWFPTAVRMTAFVAVAPPLALYLSERENAGIAGIIGALVLSSSIAYLALLVRVARLDSR